MTAPATGSIAVTGASLFYKRAGGGPLLLLCAGGSGDADSFDALTERLAPHFTTVSYDRRGYARSPRVDRDDPAVIDIAAQSRDALALIQALGHGPAFVFGSSLGAVIALDLTLRHRDRVRLLVAHEPPLGELRGESERVLPRPADFPGATPQEALAAFGRSIGVSRTTLDAAAEVGARSGTKAANAAFFLSHEAPAVGRFRLDFAGLKQAAGQVVFAGGEAGREYFPYRCAKRAAEISGAPFVEFPGHHAGYVQFPDAFATRLIGLYAAA
jgi:pimeloyl-ACP methyl ester carboxylesterase